MRSSSWSTWGKNQLASNPEGRRSAASSSRAFPSETNPTSLANRRTPSSPTIRTRYRPAGPLVGAAPASAGSVSAGVPP